MIRRYQPDDHRSIAQIFHDAIYQIASKDYTPEQIIAWAGTTVNFDYWQQRCARKQPFVFERDGEVVGFIELDPDGHIDCTYVDPRFARQGIMSRLMHSVKQTAVEQNIGRLFAEVSRTARPFFEKHDFMWVRYNQVTKLGVAIDNYIMECTLQPENLRSKEATAS